MLASAFNHWAFQSNLDLRARLKASWVDRHTWAEKSGKFCDSGSNPRVRNSSHYIWLYCQYYILTVLKYFINYQFKTTFLFTVVYTKIIHCGVILSSAKLVLASCNQAHHINQLTLPQQPCKVVMTATSDYHSNKQPPLVAMATHHNTISLSFSILELLTF
jgi:hypothetical protein